MPSPAPRPARRKARVKLTDANIKAIPFQGQDPEFGPDEKLPAIFYDSEVRGFYVAVHRESKSYYVQHDVAGKSVFYKIGNTDSLPIKDARKRAMAVIVEMKSGINPNAAKKRRTLEAMVEAETEGFTLADAVKLHLHERKKERSEKTIAEYEKIFNTHLKEFLSKPLTWIGANQFLIEELHDKITKHGWDTGKQRLRGWKNRRPAPYAANGMVRALRAAYNHARVKKPHLNLPEFRPIELNPEESKDSSLTLDQLPLWYEAVMGLPNPIRRDLQLFLLFTGNRSTATVEMRWEHVDLTGAINGVPSVFIPTPKGGKAKAFYIPLSDYLVKLLTARRECPKARTIFGADCPWVFPADADSGHVQDPAEKKHPFLKDFSPHALRHSYITFAQFAAVNLTDIAFLVNQRPKNITVQYMKALLGPLAERQQTITNYIQGFLAKKDA